MPLNGHNSPVGATHYKDAPHTQVVVADDGRRESLWVWSLILLVLALGATGIYLRQVPQVTSQDEILMTPSQSQQLVSLSIALEEIRFVASSPWPSLDELVSLGVDLFVPTAEYLWHQPEAGCYQWVSLHQQGDFLLRLQDGAIYWHAGAVEPLNHCQPDNHWILLEN